MIDINNLKNYTDFLCKHFDKYILSEKEKDFLINEFLKSEIITLNKLHNITLDINRLDPSYKEDAHSSHCCVIHGCKYGDKNCPVVIGKIKQEYMCEFCDDYNNELKYFIND